jgi:lycopene beta-cyclase
MKWYDFVIAGAGCSGLSLAAALAKAKIDKSILLIDRKIHVTQDKNWCYWEDDAVSVQPLKITKWQKLSFYALNYEKKEKILPYQYVGLRSEDFYKYCYALISQCNNIEVREENVEKIYEINNVACLETKTQKIHCSYLFNATENCSKPSSLQFTLKQHFQGWLIKTIDEVFEKDTVTWMDFRTEQHNDVRFFYVLPFSEKEALIEYTVFSKNILPDEVYEEQIEKYIRETLSIDSFSVNEKEKGVIPMAFNMPDYSSSHIIPIGIAGGAIKPSTGFAFSLIQKQINKIVKEIKAESFQFERKKFQTRFSFYDKILLYLLQEKDIKKEDIFISLFKGNSMATILTFLSERTTLWNELKIFSTLPVKMFLNAMLEIYLPRRKKERAFSPVYQATS